MVRKSMADKLKQTTNDQQKANADRFSNADTLMLKEASGTTGIDEKKKVPQQETKLVRDGFLMPERDHALVKAAQDRLLAKGMNASKTEIYRAALHALHSLSDAEIEHTCRSLEPVKRGRPGV